MVATLRELKERRNSVAATMKITKAMELIAASRVTRAQQRAAHSEPYTRELVRAVSTVAAYSHEEHPLAREHAEHARSAILVISSDRGLAGGFPGNINRAAEGLIDLLEEQSSDVEIYTCGRKAKDYFEFRGVEIVQSWQGFSDSPHYEQAKEIGEVLIERFLKHQAEGGISQVYVVYTQFKSLVSQQVRIVRLLPLEIVDFQDESLDIAVPDHLPTYHFEPDPRTVLDALLPMYIIDTIKFMLRESAASELAARQQAMHSATDNAKTIIDDLTRQANQARQAEITQEINEIVGGAGALSES